MTRYVGSVASIALFAAMPASAQLLGGAGRLGGGIGGGMGGIGGGASGMLGSGVDRLPATASTSGQARNGTRLSKQVDARRGSAAVSGATGIDGNVAASADAANRSPALSGTASTSAERTLAVDARSLPTRGIVAAERRGLRRVDQTARGVPVFVAATAAAPVAAVRVAAVPYPVYPGGVYGGGDVVIQGDAGGYMDRQYRDLRQGVEGTGATVFRRGNDLVVQLPGDVTFAFDKADIRPRFVPTLSTVARILDDYPGTDVEIMGHTDSIGSDRYNLALSERRGRNVADFLVAENTDPRRLVVEALGKFEPIATNATVAGRAANRRVEIVLHPRNG